MGSHGNYTVYTIEFLFASGTRHFGIYVATDSENGGGDLLHVRCAIGQPGMMFERQYFVGHGPESVKTFVAKHYVSSVRVEDLDHLAYICSSVSAPSTQYIHGVCQCTTWVENALQAVREAGIIV
ncbi:hypothetical protein V8C42DRAFT_358710 [Trichoderma barbatum]